MKKVVRTVIAAAVLMALAFAAAPGAMAQGGVSGYTSGISVQNLGSGQANVVITFYNQDGSVGGTTPTLQLNAGASTALFPIQAVTSGFNGSAIISSDQPVAAITNLLAGSQYSDSAIGVSGGSTTVSLPLIVRRNSGINSWFNVQNAGSSDASVTVKFTPVVVNGAPVGNSHTQTASIKPGAAVTFDQATRSQLGEKFVGSATVTSNQPVAVTVNQVGTASTKTLTSYNGFPNGATKFYLPLLQALNNGIYTGISIQNTSNSNATVTVTYGRNAANNGFSPAPDTLQLGPGASGVLVQKDGKWTNKYVGSAIITSNQPIVAVVNQVQPGALAQGSSYAGFSDAGLTRKVSLPLLVSANAGVLFSGFSCQNTSGSATNITVQYAPNAAGGFQPQNQTYANIGAGASVVVLQSGAGWTGKYVGAATVTSSAGNIACTVNQYSTKPSGDNSSTYNGINY